MGVRREWGTKGPGLAGSVSKMNFGMKITRSRVLWALLGVVAVFAVVVLARRFKERLLAIPPRGGTPFSMSALSTPHYRQHDPRWAEERIGGLGETVGRVGCTLCSLAMALEYYGVRMPPKELNEFLKANGGYNPRGWLRWNSVEKVSGGKITMEYLGRPSHAVVDRALKNAQPALAKVYIDAVIPHWVLIVGKEGEEYTMRDPLGEENRLGKVSDYGGPIYAVRILGRTSPVR